MNKTAVAAFCIILATYLATDAEAGLFGRFGRGGVAARVATAPVRAVRYIRENKPLRTRLANRFACADCSQSGIETVKTVSPRYECKNGVCRPVAPAKPLAPVQP